MKYRPISSRLFKVVTPEMVENCVSVSWTFVYYACLVFVINLASGLPSP